MIVSLVKQGELAADASARTRMGASQSGYDGEIPWFVQCDGHYLAKKNSKNKYKVLRLEGHGAVSARVSEARDETTFGTWRAVAVDAVHLVIADVTYVMRATDGVHNTVYISELDADGEADTFAFIDEEGPFANSS